MAKLSLHPIRYQNDDMVDCAPEQAEGWVVFYEETGEMANVFKTRAEADAFILGASSK